MIKYILVLLFSTSILHAQNNSERIVTDVEVGDVFEIGKPETNRYKHIDFPRANFIIKRGGIANYKHPEGKIVVVTAVKEKKDGSTHVKIKRKDSGRFFGSHTVVSADIKKAVAAGELQAR
ncbi:hypothetical protein [Cellulophaga sp. Z1A5H]|uniref:hypothetical protein n=1 Tax=Cellulophaga sp. Z1A5H TaxID=2687291 RepID=UPI0013FD895A|nr:hypothetical protein [Cellulophaga sp. Z1A5H]